MSKALDDYLTEQHKDDPEALDAAIAERDRWLDADPRDIDGVRVFPGAMVQYAMTDLAYPWTPKRWGIATGLVVTPVIFSEEGAVDMSVIVVEVGSTSDQWFSCDPARLRVLNGDVTP